MSDNIEVKMKAQDVVSISEAARRLGKTRATLYAWMGKTPPLIQTVLVAGHRVVPISEIDRLTNDE